MVVQRVSVHEASQLCIDSRETYHFSKNSYKFFKSLAYTKNKSLNKPVSPQLVSIENIFSVSGSSKFIWGTLNSFSSWQFPYTYKLSCFLHFQGLRHATNTSNWTTKTHPVYLVLEELLKNDFPNPTFWPSVWNWGKRS